MAQLKNYAYQMEQQDTKRREISELSSISSGDMTDHETEERSHSSSSALDLSVFASQTPIHEGMVFKIGGKGRMSRIQKRFFILYEGVIIYYHHRTTYKKDKKRGFKAGKVIRLDDMYLSKPESHPSRMKFCAVLHVPHESNKHKKLLIAFHHRKDKNMWVELLQTQNPQLKPSLSEELGSKKKLPLYIQKMREIEYFNPKSRYHMSRFHSLPNAHAYGSLTSQDLQSLMRIYDHAHSFSSLPASYHGSQSSLGLSQFHHDHGHRHVRLSYMHSLDSETISEVEERECEECEEVESEGDSDSGLRM